MQLWVLRSRGIKFRCLRLIFSLHLVSSMGQYYKESIIFAMKLLKAFFFFFWAEEREVNYSLTQTSLIYRKLSGQPNYLSAFWIRSGNWLKMNFAKKRG